MRHLGQEHLDPVTAVGALGTFAFALSTLIAWGWVPQATDYLLSRTFTATIITLCYEGARLTQEELGKIMKLPPQTENRYVFPVSTHALPI